MVRKGRQRRLLLLGVLSVTLMGLTAFSRVQYGSGLSNDSYLIQNAKNNSTIKSVQGASTTESTSLCPEDKPIIGWVGYDGNKTIKYSLPEGEFASACFSNIQEAKAAGYLN